MAWWIIGTDHLKGKIMSETKVVNKTHFNKLRHDKDDGTHQWQWYWKTVANNGKSVGVGGEGYDELRDAVNGFFSTHGVDPGQASLHCEFSKIEKFTDDHYVITQYGDN